jgi:RNA polymerase sigma-70 factor (ECF subfamily)
MAPTDSGSDEVLVAAAKSDSASFGALYERYLPQVYRYLVTRASSPEEAADLTQAVFLKAYDGLARYKPGKAPFAAWLFRIARNAAIDSHRRERPVVPWERAPELESEAGSSGEDSVLRAERLRELRGLLAELEPEKRDLLALRYAGGLTSTEIASLVGKKPEAVKKQLQRTLQQLKEPYRDQHE